MEERIWHKSYAPGVKKTLDYEKLTISQALSRSAKNFPNHIALNYMGKKITYRELDGLVNRFARALSDLGVEPGDKVAVCLPNIPQVIITNLAVLRIGAVAVQQFVSWFPDLHPGEERLVGNFPVFHIAGFTTGQNLSIWQSWENILVPRPDAKINIDILKKYKPTFLPAVPTIFVGLLADPDFRKLDFSFLRGFFSGAAPLAADTIQNLKEISGKIVCEGYGTTETACLATSTPWGGTIKPGTVGVPLPDTDIKIVNTENPDKEMELGEPGEIAIKGPQIMLGYYNKPEETKEALRDGWFLTGDLGKFDEDGYLTIVDRKKDMIIAGGYNIYPVELDGVLMGHPKILEACTIGRPHEYRGETVKAFIVVKAGETLTAEEVSNYCKENLAPYKVPKIIEFIDELPKSAVGKILRRKLKEMEVEKIEKVI